MTRLRRHMRLLGRYFVFNLQSSMEYRSSFFIKVFGMVLNNGAFLLFWWALFTRMERRIGGYNFGDVMVIWALVSAGYGLAMILFGNVHRLGDIIARGELDTYLLQPKSVLWNVAISRTEVSAWGDLLYGLVLFFLVQPLTLLNAVYFVAFTVSGAVLIACVIALGHTMTFFFGRASGLGTLVQEFLVTLSIYPEGIFQGVLRFVMYSLVPAGFISFIPVRLLRDFDPVLAAELLGFDVLAVAVTFFVFARGLHRYESGNRMLQRL